MEWKNKLEKDIGVNYTLHSGSKRTPYGSKQVYYCRRSGTERVSSHNEGNKRARKSQGIYELISVGYVSK